jgi:hypothetical protein
VRRTRGRAASLEVGEYEHDGVEMVGGELGGRLARDVHDLANALSWRKNARTRRLPHLRGRFADAEAPVGYYFDRLDFAGQAAPLIVVVEPA